MEINDNFLLKLSDDITEIKINQATLLERVSNHLENDEARFMANDARLDALKETTDQHDKTFTRIGGYAVGASGVFSVVLYALEKAWSYFSKG